jgi:glycosyltransferase involved in cell wall biosynthesis
MVQTLLNSLRELVGLDHFQPQIIVGDNNSQDETPKVLHSIAKNFPVPLTLLKIQRRGKSAALNEASREAHGDVLAFLDDDVVVQPKLALRGSAILRGKRLPSRARRDPDSPCGCRKSDPCAD